MPILNVSGVPRDVGDEPIEDLKLGLRQAVARVEELIIEADEVLVFVPGDQGKVGGALVAEVRGIFRRPERTPEIFAKLRETICAVLIAFANQWLSECRSVEASVAYTMEPGELTMYLKGPGEEDVFERTALD